MGVDCNNGLIWDHTEIFSLKLTLENLHRWCGKVDTPDKIGRMAKLVKKGLD